MQETLKLFALHWGVWFFVWLFISYLFWVAGEGVLGIKKFSIMSFAFSLATFSIHWGLT